MSIPNVDLSGSGGTGNISSTGGSSFVPRLTEKAPISDFIDASPLADPPAGNPSAILPQPISILDFASLINTVTNEQIQTGFITQQANDLLLTPFYNANIQAAGGLIGIASAIKQLENQIVSTYNGENTNEVPVNNAINAYNSDVTSATNTMNQAITDYNNGSINTTQYNLDVQTYNNDVSNANTTVNNAISTYNATVVTTNSNITSYNTTLKTVGSRTMTLQQQASPVAALPVEQISPPKPVPALSNPATVPQVTNTISPPTPSTQQALQNFYYPFFNLFTGFFELFASILSQIANYQSYLQFILSPVVVSLPAAFTTPLPVIGIAGSAAAGSGAGVSLTSMISTLSNPLTAAIIDSEIFSSENVALGQPLPPNLVDSLLYLNLSLLTQVGLSAGSPALRLLIGRLPSLGIESSPIALAVALAFSSQLLAAASTPDFQKAILGLLSSAFPGASAASLSNLANLLTAASSVLFLSVGITSIAQAIGNSQLFAQILGSLNASSYLSALQTSSQQSFTNVLNNAVSLAYLESTLAASLALDQNISAANAQTIITTAINQAISSGNITNEQQLETAIAAQLAKQGINKNEANSLASLAGSFVTAEASSNNLLDTVIALNTLNSQTAASQLAEAGIDSGEAASALASAIAAGESATYRQFRDQLASALTAGGVNPNTSLIAATGAILPPLTAANLQSLPLSAINTQLSSQILANFTPTLGAQQAQVMATELTSTITTLSNSLNSHLQTIVSQGNQKVTNNLDDLLRTFLQPSLSVFNFNQSLLDPARTLINMWSIMTSKNPMPSNFGKTLDIQI